AALVLAEVERPADLGAAQRAPAGDRLGEALLVPALGREYDPDLRRASGTGVERLDRALRPRAQRCRAGKVATGDDTGGGLGGLGHAPTVRPKSATKLAANSHSSVTISSPRSAEGLEHRGRHRRTQQAAQQHLERRVHTGLD